MRLRMPVQLLSAQSVCEAMVGLMCKGGYVYHGPVIVCSCLAWAQLAHVQVAHGKQR